MKLDDVAIADGEEGEQVQGVPAARVPGREERGLHTLRPRPTRTSSRRCVRRCARCRSSADPLPMIHLHQRTNKFAPAH